MKTKINTISLLILAVLFAVSASWSADLLYQAGIYYVNMPSNGDDALTLDGSIGTFKIYDNGGSGGSCSGGTNKSAYLTMTAPDNYVFQVTGTYVGQTGRCGGLGLYDGQKTDAQLYYSGSCVTASNLADVGLVRSTDKYLTVYTDCYDHNLELDVSLLNTAVTHTVTPATVTGGSAVITPSNDVSVNTTVSVKLQPSTGYLPVALNATSSDNTPVNLNLPSSFDYTVSFTMPYGNVSVTPAFTNVLTASGGVFVNMPLSDSKTYSIPTGVSSFNIYDHGGAANYISENHNAIAVLNAPEGKIMKITGLATTNTYTGGGVTLYKGDATNADPTSYSAIQQIEFDDYEKSAYDVGTVYINSNTVSVKYVAYYSNYNNQDLALSVELLDGSVTHDVPAEISVTGGTVSSNLDKAVFGQTVTLTVTPNENYALGAIEIVANGEKVPFIKPVTNPGLGVEEQITFEMPYGDVTITPVFTNPAIATFDSDGGLNNYSYFHMECDQNTYVCTVSQGVEFDRYRNDDHPEDWKDFKYWFRNQINKDPGICLSECKVYSWKEPCDCEYGLLDVYKEYYKGYSIKLAGDLHLGGNNGGQCALQFEAFEDDVNRQGNVLEIDGDGHVIDGLCQTSATHAGFVYAGNQPLSVSKVTFTNAYISSDGFTGAGVIAAEAAEGVTISDVKVENSTVHGSTNIGGLVGYAAGTISIQNVSFGGTVSGKGPNTIVGGLVGFTMPSNMIIEKSFVDGDVINPSAQVTPNGALTNNRVGGLVGAVAGGQIDLTIKNTYSIGEIISATYTSSTDSVGYIVGSISAGLSDASRIVNNYHFGDDEVELGVGGIYNAGYDADIWKQGVSGICYGNVRNSTTSISATGTMGYHRNDTYDASAQDKTFVDFFAGSVGTSDPIERTANGVASEADMKSGLLAALMNYNQEAEGEPDLWVSDGDVPVFAGTSDKPNHLVVVQTKQITDAQKIIDGGLEPVQEKYSKDNNGAISHSILASGLTAYTDASGVLSPNATSIIAAVKAAVADNAGVEEEDVAIVDATGKVASLTDEFTSSQVYSTLVNYTVSFDLSSLDSRTVVLGGDWAASKSGMNVETNNNLPRVYIMAQAGTTILYSNAVWGSEKVLTDQSAYTSNYLTERLLSDVNPTSSKIKLYPVENRLATEAKTLRVVAYDEGGNALTGDTDYHGSVVLSQVVGDGVDDLKQTSDLCGNSTGAANNTYGHCLYLPDAADTLTFKVSFDPEDGYTMDLIKFDFDWTDPTGALGEAPAGYGYDASTGKLLISLPHMANNDMTLRVKYTVTGSFYVKYNLNSDPMYNSDLYFPVDAVPSETLKFDATHTSQKLWEPYRADDDVCFEGWSAPKKNTYVFKTLPADSAAFLLSMDPDAPTELTANWLSPCTKNLRDPITIANGSTKSSVRLIQKYGTGEFDHWLTNDIVLPENSGIGYKFFVDKANSVASFGYTLDDAVLELDLNGNRAQLEMKGDSMVVGTTANESNFLVSFETTPVPLNFTFHMNTKDTVFYGNDWVSEVNGVTLGSAGPVWPQHIARLNACFTGWSATGKEHDVGYADLNSNGAAGMLSTSPFDMVEMDDGTGQLVSKPVFRMYAMWDENCQNGYPATYKLSTNVAEVAGSFKVYQVIGTDTIARFVTAGNPIAQLKSDDYEFYIDFVPSPLYHLTSSFDMSATYSSDTDPDVLTENVWSSYPYVFTSLANSPAGATEVTLTASGFGVSPLRFVLDVNADSVFYGMGFYEFESEFVDGDALPGDIYRTEYEHVGWSFENGKTTVTQPANLVYQAQTHEFFNDAMVQEYGMYYKTYGRYPDTLFAVWTAIKDPQVNVVVNKSADKASFRLYREIDGRKIEFLVSDSLKVPATRGFEFNVETIYDSREWTIDGKFPITLVDAKNDTIGTVENFFMVNESMGMIANLVAVPKPVNTSVRVALDENSKDSVYFGSDWIDEMVYDGKDSVQLLPTIVYNAEKCLAGWTVDSTSSELLTVIDKDLLNDLRARSKTQNVDISALLYAKWTTNLDSCAGDFTQLAVEQENGNIWLAEGDAAKTIERRFTDKGTMFVPHELKGSTFKVQAKADSSFMLDSLVVYRHGEVDTVLFEGDYMPENLEYVTLKAFFGKSNKTPVAFVKKRMVRSGGNGNAFQLNFKASDFEVTRGITARVQIIDVTRNDTINTVLGDSVAMGFEDRFVFRMSKPGDYRMVLSLEEDGKEPVEYSEEFSVDASIAAVAKDGWQMLSLSAIDFEAIDWDDEDQIFYWWDEHGTGEFWQYKQLTKSDSMVNTRGVWYNSLEGRPLPLKFDIEDNGEDFAWNLDSVSTGWNLVANPHGWTVDLYSYNADKLKGVDEESEITFYRYDAETGDHDTVLSVKPYEAVWAHVSKKTKWKVSADPVFDFETGKAAEKSRALAKATTKDRWTLQAVLSDEKGKRDSWNILGAGLNPILAEEPPESMGDHVNLSIVDGKRALAKSIKPSSDEMEWTVALSASSDRVGYLSFAGIEGVNGYGYRVFVTVDGNTTEMQEGMPLKVYLKSTAKTATVRVAPAARVVARNTLKGLRMARLGGKLKVSFDAVGLAGTNARVDILDMKGNVKSTVTAKTLEGSNALVLDAPQSGLYMLRVRAGSQQQATKIVVQ